MKKILIIILAFCLLIVAAVTVVNADEGTSTTVQSLSIKNYPLKTVYGAFEELEIAGLDLEANYSDGSRKSVNSEEISIIYSRDKCLRAGDSYVTLSYGGKSVLLPVTVNRIAYDLSSLDLGSVTTEYNGKYQSYTELLPTFVGLDGIALTISAVGGGINVGEYDVSIDFETKSLDYLTPESRVVTMKIEPAKAEIVWSELSFTYDGKSKSPIAQYLDVNKKTIYPSVIGAATNAGSYTAKVSTNDPNYIFSSTSVEYEIKKADYDLSNVKWSTDSFIYDGSKKSVTLSGLPSGVSVKGYAGDAFIDAGKYTASAELDWDKTNYNPPAALIHRWEIMPADYDLSSFRFESASYVYDGEMHYPKLVGEMPVGRDGIALEYSFSSGACHVDDGVVSVIISFKTDSKNYNTPEKSYSSVNISPKGITVTWQQTELYYIGDRQAPTALANECSIKVSGGALTVGKYTAKAESCNSDYYVINSTGDFYIKKADNYWTTDPSASTCYEGREIALNGKSRFGDLTYQFYLDPQGKTPIDTPTIIGKYYARITVSDTMNFSGLVSEIIPFEIVEIRPVAFIAEILRDNLRAFETLATNDIICSVVNNDGSKEKIDSSLVKIYYQNGNSFRKADDKITFKYEKMVLTLSVEVDYADYDLSKTVWLNAVTIYNGSPQTPMLYGLPEGVKVIDYVGSDVIDAGNYSVSAVLDYDSENYNEPIIPSCSFVIEKKPINVPFIQAIYNGETQKPLSDSNLYLISSAGNIKDVGIYSMTVTLLDTKNYTFFETQSAKANGIFEIKPAEISVKISDTKLHLFEDIEKAEYNILLGEIFDGDNLTMSFFTNDGEIYAKSENPNYTLKVTPGKLIRLPYPTFDDGIRVGVIILVMLLCFVTLIFAFKKRHKLVAAAAVIRCRWHHRNFKAPSPKPILSKTPSEDETDRQETEENEISVDSDEEELQLSSELKIPDTEIDAPRADMLITDSLAKSLLKKEGDVIYTEGGGREIVSINAINNEFLHGEIVDVNRLKEKGIVSEETAYIRVIGEGKLDRPLTVYANEFNLSAIKMITLCGGSAKKCITLKGKPREEKE